MINSKIIQQEIEDYVSDKLSIYTRNPSNDMHDFWVNEVDAFLEMVKNEDFEDVTFEEARQHIQDAIDEIIEEWMDSERYYASIEAINAMHMPGMI